MKKLYLIALSTLLCTTTAAETFWAHSLQTRADLPYGDHELQRMDMHMHGERTGEGSWFVLDETPRPTLVWIHGGGWLMGDKGSQLPQLIPFLQRGWNVFNVNYRQGPGTAPLAVDDVMCAYKAVLKELTKSGQPTDRVVVSGASAGGHLALVTGLLNARGEHPCSTAPAPAAIVNWFGITDIGTIEQYLQKQRPNGNYARQWIGSRNDIARISRDFSPVNLLSDQAPPILTIHGTADTVVPYAQAQQLHDKLTTTHRLLKLEDANHGGASDAQFQQAYQAIFDFLRDI